MIRFSKMQGAGNDFIIINLWDGQDVGLSDLAKLVCDRHFGIGADGLMAVKKSKISDVQMNYYNSDGSLGEMCGNGIRCFSKYVFDKGIVNKKAFTVETLAGEKIIHVNTEDNKVVSVDVDMGKWSFVPSEIPALSNKEKVILEKIEVDEDEVEISCVLMGVPHAVVFVEEIKPDETIRLGSKIEKLDRFPQKINVNFVKVVDKSNILVDTWERGAGKTLACGTGACASVIIANKLGLVEDSVDVTVLGGDLKISITKEDRIMMEGKAAFICDGEFYE